MRVITLEKTKALLGITDTTYDTLINTQIPIIDAKVKQICNNNFNRQLAVSVVDGDATVTFSGGADYYGSRSWPDIELLLKDLPVGTQLEGTGIPADTYISEVYYAGRSLPYFEMSAPATADNAGYIYAGINIAYQSTIAKCIMWLIGRTNTTIYTDDWKSRSVGPLSVTKGTANEKLDGMSGLPSDFVREFPRWHR